MANDSANSTDKQLSPSAYKNTSVFNSLHYQITANSYARLSSYRARRLDSDRDRILARGVRTSMIMST